MPFAGFSWREECRGAMKKHTPNATVLNVLAYLCGKDENGATTISRHGFTPSLQPQNQVVRIYLQRL